MTISLNINGVTVTIEGESGDVIALVGCLNEAADRLVKTMKSIKGTK